MKNMLIRRNRTLHWEWLSPGAYTLSLFNKNNTFKAETGRNLLNGIWKKFQASDLLFCSDLDKRPKGWENFPTPLIGLALNKQFIFIFVIKTLLYSRALYLSWSNTSMATINRKCDTCLMEKKWKSSKYRVNFSSLHSTYHKIQNVSKSGYL